MRAGVYVERLEGINSVLSALKGGREITRIFVVEGKKGRVLDEIVRLAAERGIPVNTIKKASFEAMSRSAYAQGVLAEAKDYQYAMLDDMLELARSKGEEPFIVVLDGVEDPQNLGSIIRTAECAGVHGVIIPRHRAAGITAAVARASAGAIHHMLIAQVTNISQTLDDLKEKGCWVIGADMDGDICLGSTSLPTPAVLVIGGEGRGMRRLVREKCDLTVRIPMWGKTGSLNAGVSAALLIYEVVRGRIIEGEGRKASPHR